MNGSQKTGIGMILAVIIFAIPQIADAFGANLPAWIPVVAQIITTVAGIFGISINLPSNTTKVTTK